MASPPEPALNELTPDVFLCIGCGAQVSFDDAEDASRDTPLAQATCPYCDVVNDRALAQSATPS
jgi:DNA-directed RNA polymerase subunit RPC12/RpoP